MLAKMKEQTKKKVNIKYLCKSWAFFQKKNKTAFIASRKRQTNGSYIFLKEVLNTHSQETRMHKYKTRFELPFTLYIFIYIYILIHHNSLNPQRF